MRLLFPMPASPDSRTSWASLSTARSATSERRASSSPRPMRSDRCVSAGSGPLVDTPSIVAPFGYPGIDAAQPGSRVGGPADNHSVMAWEVARSWAEVVVRGTESWR